MNKHCIRCGLTKKEIRKDRRLCQLYDKGFKTHIYKKG